MPHTQDVVIASDALTVAVSPEGAELRSIVDAEGRDWLWDGDPAWWTGRAPILFPTVGALAGDVARFGGHDYPMKKHGFARGSRFAPIVHHASSATFRLEAGEATRRHYPFAFRLDVTHALDGATLMLSAVVTNAGDTPMPVGLGFHPALRWPLPGAGALSKPDHILRFDAPEPEPIRAVSPDGLIAPATKPTPVADDELRLHDSLFDHDALVFDRPNSRGLWFGVPDRPGVRLDFPDMPMLGVWTKPGAGFLCIEPWHARADDEGFAGDFADKPDVLTLAPGEHRTYAIALTFGVPF